MNGPWPTRLRSDGVLGPRQGWFGHLPEWWARWVALPVGVLAVSTSGILIRLTDAHPLQTVTFRLLGAALILLGIGAITQRRDFGSIDRRSGLLVAASGLLVGLHFALWTTSLFWTSVASAVLLTDTHPVLVALSARAFLSELTPPGVWAGIALTLLGTTVIGAGDFQLGGRALLGDLMALGASVTFAGYLVIGRRVRQRMGIAVYAGTVYAVGGVLVAAAAAMAGISLLEVSGRDALIWLALILIPTLAGHTVLNWALRHVPASVVGVSIVGEPVLTTILAATLLGEAPPTTAMVGGAAVLAGLCLALRSPEEQRGHRRSLTPPDPGGAEPLQPGAPIK